MVKSLEDMRYLIFSLSKKINNVLACETATDS